MLPVLVLLPAVAAALCFLTRSAAVRRALLLATAAGHAGLSLATWVRVPGDAWGGALRLDAIGQPFLSVLSARGLPKSRHGHTDDDADAAGSCHFCLPASAREFARTKRPRYTNAYSY
jgi:hypothetical protein